MGPLNPIVTAGDKEECELESILKHRWQQQVMGYIVHCYGYDEAEDNWVSEQDLIHAHQILQ